VNKLDLRNTVELVIIFKTISSAYIRQDTFMLLIVMGSHMLSNSLTISFRYNEKCAGLKYILV
jgi:hypothetical protein